MPLGVEALVRNAMSRMGTDRSKLAEAMHNLDVGSDVLAEFPPCAEVFDQVTGRERCPRRWSMLTQSGVVGGSSCRLSAAWPPAITDHVRE